MNSGIQEKQKKKQDAPCRKPRLNQFFDGFLLSRGGVACPLSVPVGETKVTKGEKLAKCSQPFRDGRLHGEVEDALYLVGVVGVQALAEFFEAACEK